MPPNSPPPQPASNSRSPLSIIFPILAGLACLVDIPALVIHVRARNMAVCVLIISYIVSNVFTVLNSLIWPTELPQGWWNGTGLCDIEVKLQIALSVANFGAVACIFRQLAVILDTDRTVLKPSSTQLLRKPIFEIGFCVGLPMYLIVAHYFVQPFRYYITPVAGCRASFDNSWLSIVLIFVWPPIICLVAIWHGALATYRLIKYRRQFSVIFCSSTSSMTKSRFFKLYVLSASLISIYLPLSIFTFERNTSIQLVAYSWKRVHPQEWSQLIVMLPVHFYQDFDRWVQIGIAFIIIAFFGFGQEARALYRDWLSKIKWERSRKARANSTEQTPLSSLRGFSDLEPEDCLNVGICVTLHESKAVEKTPNTDVPPIAGRSLPSLTSALSKDDTARTPCHANLNHIKTIRGRGPAFEIWCDKEPESSASSVLSPSAKERARTCRVPGVSTFLIKESLDEIRLENAGRVRNASQLKHKSKNEIGKMEQGNAEYWGS